MSKNINSQLLELQMEWLAACAADEMAKKYPLSRPFSFAVTDQYLRSKKRIMIVGQEARDYGSYDSDRPLPDIQKFNICYVNTQLYRPVSGYEFNKSPFWKLFRRLEEHGFEPVWNNLDKFHRVIDANTKPLTVEIEKEFSKPYGLDNTSLLQREVEVAKPNIVAFVTGPNYHESMALALGVDDSKLQECRPTIEHPSKDITSVMKLGVPTIWTYHPAYLQRIKSMQHAVHMAETVWEQYCH